MRQYNCLAETMQINRSYSWDMWGNLQLKLILAQSNQTNNNISNMTGKDNCFGSFPWTTAACYMETMCPAENWSPCNIWFSQFPMEVYPRRSRTGYRALIFPWSPVVEPHRSVNGSRFRSIVLGVYHKRVPQFVFLTRLTQVVFSMGCGPMCQTQFLLTSWPIFKLIFGNKTI